MNAQDLPRNTPVDALYDIAHRNLDYSNLPYSKLQPVGMIADLVIPGTLQGALDPLARDPHE